MKPKGPLVGCAALLLFPAALLSYFVWPPDVFSGRILIVQAKIPAGTLEVHQQWNHVDFYTTRVDLKLKEGSTYTCIVDADDKKRWWGRIEQDEPRVVKIYTEFAYVGRVEIDRLRFVSRNGRSTTFY